MKIISAAYHIHFHPACSSVTLVPPPDQAPSELQGLALCPWGRSDGPRLRTARQQPSPCPTQWSAGLGELGLSGGKACPGWQAALMEFRFTVELTLNKWKHSDHWDCDIQ